MEKNVALDRSKRRRLVTQGGWVCMTFHKKVRRFEIERLKSHSTDKQKKHVKKGRVRCPGKCMYSPILQHWERNWIES